GGRGEVEGVGGVVGQAELGGVARSNEGARPDLKLGVAVGARVQDVAGCQRRVGFGLGPLLGAGTPEGYLAVEVAHARRRDLAGLLRGRRVGSGGRSGPADRAREDEKRDDDPSIEHWLHDETHRSARIFTLYPDLGSFDSSKPSGRGINVLLALPAAPGQARAIESLIDDAVLRGGRTGRPFFHALPVVA